MPTHVVTIRRELQRNMNPAKLQQNMNKIKEAALKHKAKKGWTLVIANQDWFTPNTSGGNVSYEVHLKLSIPDDKITEKEDKTDMEAMVKAITKAGIMLNSAPWEIITIDGKAPVDNFETAKQRVTYTDVKLKEDWKTHFNHIYEREDQRDIVISAVQAAIDSDFANRFHVALIGPPAGGKTALLTTLKKVLGQDAILEFDATATTAAGAIQELESRDEMPRILIVEEIEKADEKSLQWLLGVGDDRAEINKVVFRKQVHKECKMLILCTVNNQEKFEHLAERALASRFPFKVECPVPSKDAQKRFLHREISKVNGEYKWADPVLAYAELNGITDFRTLKALALAGKGSTEFLEKIYNCTKK